MTGADSLEVVPAGYEDCLWEGGMDQDVVLVSVKHKDKPPLLCTINNWPEYVKEGGRIIISTVDAPEPLTNVRAIRLKEYTQQTKFNLTSVAKVVCRDKKTIPLYKVLDTIRSENGIQTKRMKPTMGQLPEGSPLSMFNATLVNRGLPPSTNHLLGSLQGAPMYATNATPGLPPVNASTHHLQPHATNLHLASRGMSGASTAADDVMNLLRQTMEPKKATASHPFARDEIHDLHRGRPSTGPVPSPRDDFDLLTSGGAGAGGPDGGGGGGDTGDGRPPASTSSAAEARADQPIEWIGNPMGPEEVGVSHSDIVAVERLYYRGFVRGDAVLRVGDCVQVDLGNSRRPQVASILLLWSEAGDDGSTQHFARCQAFYWPRDTIYADIHWPPSELFASDHCHEALPLPSLISKCTLSFRAPTGSPDLIMPMPGRPFPKTGYVCRFTYHAATQTLRPNPRGRPPAPVSPKPLQ